MCLSQLGRWKSLQVGDVSVTIGQVEVITGRGCVCDSSASGTCYG